MKSIEFTFVPMNPKDIFFAIAALGLINIVICIGQLMAHKRIEELEKRLDGFRAGTVNKKEDTK